MKTKDFLAGMAIGLLALIAILRPSHRDTALLFYVLALGGLALSRMYGLVLEHSENIFVFSLNVTKQTYNQIGLAMYELPNFIFAGILLVIRNFFIRDTK